ncbi:MAG: proton-conducting membrane transporter [Actinobacteria bacterium]|nr:proton-conducting membrane transporter [Actinomycetota bacterium]MCG2820164.1 proton-conducting membrane transporter [Actinomycetes bacterium]MBU4359030.1 proton-conducting membrane transporter [Actinomycetota bacterium]MBU4392959.1 proton-conducting membrane transporter [Actinomycetota bacterium]MBU4402232.1 proton-conducting membrane transporter [Actinomycetota bacterium]
MEHAAVHIEIANSVLPAVAILLPLLGAAAVALIGNRNERLRDIAAAVFAAGAFVTCAAMFPSVMSQGTKLTVSLPIFFGDFRLTADSLGLLFALFASLVWMLATIYSRAYIQHEERRTRYHVFSLLTEAATLGVFLASDFFVLFVFFELMGMLAYALVVHTQTYEAKKAGVKYIFMTVYGGLSLLAGVFLFLMYAGGLGFTAHPGSAYLTTSACFLVSGFMIGGFGVKAGMVPLHVWLPLAHPAAPSPASALLSGVMIKAGAYGFLRIIGTFQVGAPAHSGMGMVASGAGEAGHAAQVPVFMHNLQTLGWVIIWFGILTMVVGMVLALVQDNAKRLLAYSSISQMGYILMGLGVGAYMGAEGGMGLAGGIYHIVNHSLFKSLLFLGVGAVYYMTHVLEISRLGGLWRKMPVTCALTCIGGLGIMGMPLFNGFASKTLLHHAVVEALGVGGGWMRAVDIIFMVAAGGTVCYVAKLLILTFFGHHREESAHEITEVPWAMRLGMGGLATGVVLFGVFPGLVIRKIILPALRPFVNLDPQAVHHLEEIRIFTPANLLAILPALAIGTGIFLVATRWDLFQLRLPKKVGVAYFYTRTELGFLRLCFAGSKRNAELRSVYWPIAESFGEYLYDSWKAMSEEYDRLRDVIKPSGIGMYLYGTLKALGVDYRRFSKTAFERMLLLPMDIAGLASYVRARQFTGDIAYGVIVITAMAALLALTLFW